MFFTRKRAADSTLAWDPQYFPRPNLATEATCRAGQMWLRKLRFRGEGFTADTARRFGARGFCTKRNQPAAGAET